MLQSCNGSSNGSDMVLTDFYLGMINGRLLQTKANWGLSWIGIGLLLHSHEKIKDITMLFTERVVSDRKSPKPRDCLYTLKDHVEMIDKSVVQPLELGSFHLVAHSMGSVIALVLAAKYPNSVKSIILVAPPYSSFEENAACVKTLEMFAGKKLWPMLSAGSSFMSWYAHLSRTVCLIYCRNHRTWERILKFITRKRELSFLITDMTRHTHQSAWNSMPNVICGGTNFMGRYLKILTKSGVFLFIEWDPGKLL